MENELSEIYNQCVQIRNVILNIKVQTSSFKCFPLGCCSESSIIIAEILTEKGFKNIIYCHREVDNDFKSHAWLEYKNHIIDITANQFPEILDQVIVKSNKRRHLAHTNQISENYTSEKFKSWSIDLIKDFELIKKHITPSCCAMAGSDFP